MASSKRLLRDSDGIGAKNSSERRALDHGDCCLANRDICGTSVSTKGYPAPRSGDIGKQPENGGWRRHTRPRLAGLRKRKQRVLGSPMRPSPVGRSRDVAQRLAEVRPRRTFVDGSVRQASSCHTVGATAAAASRTSSSGSEVLSVFQDGGIRSIGSSGFP